MASLRNAIRGPVQQLARRGAAPLLHRLSAVPAPLVAARPFVPQASLHSTRRLFSAPQWASQGSIAYRDLKPETQSPSGEITIIDVREPDEVAQGIIPSAVNVPLSTFESAFSGAGGDFVRQFAFDRPAYDDKIVVYCRSGKRSAQAQAVLNKNGWKNVRNYEGSWLDWVQQEEAAKKGN